MARITTTDIDAALRDMAAADGYDGTKLYHTDRLCRSDTAPAESEYPTDDHSPVPLVKGSVMPAVVLAVCIFLAVAVCVIAWAMN